MKTIDKARPKWSWFGVLFLLAPFGMLSDQKQFPTVWVCACTKGCRKVYEKKGSGWSAIMDHLATVHGIEKDTKHPTSISSQQKKARAECKTRALDGGMTQTRFQAICTTRYIIRRLLPFSHVECPEFRLCAVKVRKRRGIHQRIGPYTSGERPLKTKTE